MKPLRLPKQFKNKTEEEERQEEERRRDSLPPHERPVMRDQYYGSSYVASVGGVFC